MLVLRIFMLLTMVFLAMVAYRMLWSKIIKPTLDKEKADDVSKRQFSNRQNNGGNQSDVTKT